MTVVNKCPDCNALLLRANSCEACGWPKVRPKHQEPPKFRSEQSAILRQKMGDQLLIVNAFVEKFKREHPGATKRDACLVFLKSKGLEHMVPVHVMEPSVGKFDDAMDDYRENVGGEWHLAKLVMP